MQSGGGTALGGVGGAAGGRGGSTSRGGAGTNVPSAAGSGGGVGTTGGTDGGTPACEDTPAGCGPSPNAGAGGEGEPGAAGSGGRGGAGGASTGGASTGGASTGRGGAGGASGGTGAGGSAGAAMLASATASVNLNTVEVGTTSSPATTWKIENRGGSPTGVPMLANSNSGELVVSSNTCTAAIPAGGSCNITVSFRPGGAGSRTGALTLAANPGGSVGLDVSGVGGYRVTISMVGATNGATVTSNPAGINCSASCTALMSGVVTLSANTKNGSNMLHTAWGGDATNCASAPYRDCMINANAAPSVTVRFSPLNNNIIFATSTLFPVNKGSASAYDADCNAAATAAGINNTAGNDYVAVMSDSASTLRTRLGNTARGWITRDGSPFADTQAALFTNNVVWNPIRFNELGRRAGAKYAFTGTTSTGAAHEWTCENWTVNTGGGPQWYGGSITGGPEVWSSGASASCANNSNAILCMGKGRSTQVTFTPATGRRIWLTNTAFALTGTTTPDQKCQSERPAGVANARALLATLTRTAGSVVDTAATYVRPDGIVVGTGAQLIARAELASGIWQKADLSYSWLRSNTMVWTGHANLGTLGTAATTCDDWSATTGTGNWSGTYGTDGWWGDYNAACTQSFQLRCVEVP